MPQVTSSDVNAAGTALKPSPAAGENVSKERLIEKTPTSRIVIGAAFLMFLCLVLPFLTTYDTLIEDIIVWSLFAIGFNMAFGFTRMVSVGHGVFFGVSAFVIGMLSKFNTSTVWNIPVGIVAGTCFAFLVGYASLKRARYDVHKSLRIAYLVLISMSASYMTMYLFLKPLSRWSGAEMGLLGFPNQPMHIVGNVYLDLLSHKQVYPIVGVVTLIMLFWLRRIATSPAGFIMRGIRENELRVGFLGYNTFRFKLLIYTLSGFASSVAGALYLLRSGFISCDVFDFGFTSELVVMCLMGGTDFFFGPLVGAAIYLIAKDVISVYTNSWAVFVSALLIVCVLYIPGGVGPKLFSLPKLIGKLFGKK